MLLIMAAANASKLVAASRRPPSPRS